MSLEGEIYSLVLRRLAEVDHGWGKPYDFPRIYVLDYAVPDVESPNADVNESAPAQPFGKELKSALQANAVDLPALTFVPTFREVYDGSRKGPIHVRDGAGFIALGPIAGDQHTATVDAMFYGGHLWARWMRYHLEHADEAWRIVSSDLLALS